MKERREGKKEKKFEKPFFPKLRFEWIFYARKVIMVMILFVRAREGNYMDVREIIRVMIQFIIIKRYIRYFKLAAAFRGNANFKLTRSLMNRKYITVLFLIYNIHRMGGDNE